jgi:hypothetical protein
MRCWQNLNLMTADGYHVNIQRSNFLYSCVIMHLTSILTSLIRHSYHYHGLFLLNVYVDAGLNNDDFRYHMFTSYIYDFKCQPQNDSSKRLQSITYCFDHMTTNFAENFLLRHQSAWLAQHIPVQISTKEERILIITLSPSQYYTVHGYLASCV